MVVYRSRPSRVMAIRTFTQDRTDQMLEIFRNIHHENILSAIECYKDGETVYFRFDDFPVTLEHLVACDAYPTETQLALILSQVTFIGSTTKDVLLIMRSSCKDCRTYSNVIWHISH